MRNGIEHKQPRSTALRRRAEQAAALLLFVAVSCTDQSTQPSDALEAPSAEAYSTSKPYDVTISPKSANLFTGDSVQLVAKVVDRRGRAINPSGVTWTSANPAAASVSSKGKVKGLQASSTKIFATISGVRDTAQIVVTARTTAPVDITTTSVPNGTVGAAYSQTVAVTGGSGTYAWTIVTGDTPAGLDLNPSTGVIAGTPAVTGSWAFTVQASSAGYSDAQALSITIGAATSAPNITTTSLPAATVGTAYSQTLSATGGNGSYAWSLSAGTLPAGLTLNASTGAIAGTPTAAGNSSFTVQATSAGQSDTQALSIAVAAATTAPEITTTSLPGATVGTAYNQTITATGGNGTYAWSIVNGGTPAGLDLNPSSGAITGTPAASGSWTFTVQATSAGQSDTQALTIAVTAATAPVNITTTSLPGGTVGTSYSQTLAATGGNGSYAWSLSAGTLPAGLTLSASTGAIAGTPTAAGSSNFTVQATSAGLSDTQALTIAVTAATAPVNITTASLPGGTVSTAYSQTLAATGGNGTYAWSLSAGTLPAGLTLNASTGAIAGTPTTAGTSSFTVRATSGSQSATKPLSIAVAAAAVPVSITTASLPNGTVSTAYSQTLTATGGNGTYSWSLVAGSVPAGLSLNSSTGAITGTPTTAGTSSFTAQATSGSQSATKALSITIATGSSGGALNECATPRAGWIFCDDFDLDRLSSYFEYKNPSGAFARVSAVGRDGSYGMRATYKPGTPDAGNFKLAFGATPDSYMRAVDNGTAKYRDIYWRMYVRTQAGWNGSGPVKLSRAMVMANSDWAQAAIGHIWTPGGSTSPNLLIDPVRGTDANGTLKTTTYNDFDNFTWLGSVTGPTPVFSAGNANVWFCVEAHMRLNDPGASNGIEEMWVNQNLEARRADLNWLGSYSTYGINAIFFENYWNAGSPVTQSRFFDNIVVSTQRIGC